MKGVDLTRTRPLTPFSNRLVDRYRTVHNWCGRSLRPQEHLVVLHTTKSADERRLTPSCGGDLGRNRGNVTVVYREGMVLAKFGHCLEPHLNSAPH